MSLKKLFLTAAALIVMAGPVRAQSGARTYFTTEQLPDLIQALPAPPDTLSAAFTYDIMRYMWGKQQRRDSLRLEMAVRDAIWSLDTTIVILGEPFGVKISKEESFAIH